MEKDIKKSFIMYLDYEEQFNLLNDEQAGKLIKIIIEYEKTGEVKEIDDGMVKMAFSFIKLQLDKDNEKWQDEIIKRRTAGKKGAESRWNKNNDEIEIEDGSVINENDKNSNAINENGKNSSAINEDGKNGNAIICYSKNGSAINRNGTAWQKWLIMLMLLINLT